MADNSKAPRPVDSVRPLCALWLADARLQCLRVAPSPTALPLSFPPRTATALRHTHPSRFARPPASLIPRTVSTPRASRLLGPHRERAPTAGRSQASRSMSESQLPCHPGTAGDTSSRVGMKGAGLASRRSRLGRSRSAPPTSRSTKAGTLSTAGASVSERRGAQGWRPSRESGGFQAVCSRSCRG